MMERYLSYVREKLKEILLNQNFTGNLTIEINIKDGGITNMNVCPKESVRMN